jgi:hypothetical protein
MPDAGRKECQMITYHPPAPPIVKPDAHPAADLSFMRTRPNGCGIEYWVTEMTGNYSKDWEAGRALGVEYLAYVGKHPTFGNGTLLGSIVLDMMEGNGAKGLILGFMSIVNQHAMAAAHLLAEHEEKAE